MHITKHKEYDTSLVSLKSKVDVETLTRVFRISHQVSKHPPSDGDPHRRVIKNTSTLIHTWFHPLKLYRLRKEKQGFGPIRLDRCSLDWPRKLSFPFPLPFKRFFLTLVMESKFRQRADSMKETLLNKRRRNQYSREERIKDFMQNPSPLATYL